MPAITGLGHVGIYTEDLMAQRDFYTRVLGLQISDEDIDGLGVVFLSADPEEEHHEVALFKGRTKSTGNEEIQQVSFKVGSIDELKEFYQRLVKEGVEVDRIISHGNAMGIYFFDPEGNRLEIYHKTGFNVPQPHAAPVDINASAEELLAFMKSEIPPERVNVGAVD